MAAPSATRERPDQALVYAALVIVAGVLATTLAQTQVLARLPLQNLLKNELHADRTANAAFFFWAGLAWYLSRQSRNQTGGRRQSSSSAVRAILDDPPIHIRPVCSRKRGCEGQEPCGFNAFQHAHGCTPPPPRPQDSSHVLSRVSS
jgi:hypothetical protein